jgi:hypothetical protein
MRADKDDAQCYGRSELKLRDLKISTLLIAISLAAVVIAGDHLFIGVWYYALVLSLGVILGLVLRPRPLFLTGVVIALDVTLWIYAQHNASPSNQEGLLVLGHIFSLPGAAVGLIASAVLIRRWQSLSETVVLMISIAGVLLGFALAQLAVCNTLMYCGRMLG